MGLLTGLAAARSQLLVGAMLGALCLGLAATEPTPWPRGQPPTPAEIDEKLGDAVELFELERLDELLEAAEEGEESEHIFVQQEKIDEGAYTVEWLFLRGDATFEHEFRQRDGYGDGTAPRNRLRRVHDGAYGGLDTFSCNGCHSQGGVNGAGRATATTFYFGDGERLSSAVMRSPPAVLGLGFVQALAHEMTARLQALASEAIATAARTGKPAAVRLSAKGVEFGVVVGLPDGETDTGKVEGVDEDLVVKPFGWKGHTASLRRFGERAARIHFGIQSHVLALEHREDPDPALMGWSHKWFDPDGDGVQRELEEGTVTALAVYMALLEAPIILPPTDPYLRTRWGRGGELFDRIGCTDCHRRGLPLGSVMWIERPDTTDGPGVRLHLVTDGEKPRAPVEAVPLFSDLKRHDMGAELCDPMDDDTGVGACVFLTRPLWGLAESAPYLHDGRASTIPEAILAHGGEAAPERAAFEALAPEQQQDVHLFLLSLTREPKPRIER